ncbi:MAG: phenylalanine--tRNA ligase subunit alpha [Actinomycetota bacterium]
MGEVIGSVDIDQLVLAAAAAANEATSRTALEAVEADYLGKKSQLAGAHRSLGSMDEQARKSAGAVLNAARLQIQQSIEACRYAVEAAERSELLDADRLDLTEVVLRTSTAPVRRGHQHLISQTQTELEDVFIGMGFTVADGPEVETDWYNFEALNIPPAHPARGMWDTFYLELGEPETVVLRTHTSPVQIHLMEEAVASKTLPIHAVMPGRCFRRDTPDARHLHTFHQIEGLVIDRGMTFVDLAGVIQTFTTAYFGADISSRLRPAFFPFTEPSAEFEITCTICHGEGCRTCSQTGWIELGGCGMVDPAVLDAVGIDPEEYSGFAFGFGIDRCAQMRHQIADMRALVENDLRFVEQF